MARSSCAKTRTATRTKNKSCYSKTELEDLLHATYDHEVGRSDDPMVYEMAKRRYGITTKRGGMSGKNDHTTTSGRTRTLQEAVNFYQKQRGGRYEDEVIPPKHWMTNEHGNPLIQHWLESSSLKDHLELAHRPYDCTSKSADNQVQLDAACMEQAVRHMTEHVAHRYYGMAFDGSVGGNVSEMMDRLSFAWEEGTLKNPRYTKIGVLVRDAERNWVSFMIHKTKHKIEYFNAKGNEPDSVTSRYLLAIVKFVSNLSGSDSVKNKGNGWGYVAINRVQHQRLPIDYGIYALIHQRARLAGKSLNQINDRRIPDKSAMAKRKEYFRAPWEPKDSKGDWERQSEYDEAVFGKAGRSPPAASDRSRRRSRADEVPPPADDYDVSDDDDDEDDAKCNALMCSRNLRTKTDFRRWAVRGGAVDKGGNEDIYVTVKDCYEKGKFCRSAEQSAESAEQSAESAKQSAESAKQSAKSAKQNARQALIAYDGAVEIAKSSRNSSDLREAKEAQLIATEAQLIADDVAEKAKAAQIAAENAAQATRDADEAKRIGDELAASKAAVEAVKQAEIAKQKEKEAKRKADDAEAEARVKRDADEAKRAADEVKRQAEITKQKQKEDAAEKDREAKAKRIVDEKAEAEADAKNKAELKALDAQIAERLAKQKSKQSTSSDVGITIDMTQDLIDDDTRAKYDNVTILLGTTPDDITEEVKDVEVYWDGEDVIVGSTPMFGFTFKWDEASKSFKGVKPGPLQETAGVRYMRFAKGITIDMTKDLIDDLTRAKYNNVTILLGTTPDDITEEVKGVDVYWDGDNVIVGKHKPMLGYMFEWDEASKSFKGVNDGPDETDRYMRFLKR